MIQSVFIIGIILSVVAVILGFVLVKAKLKGSYTAYFPIMAIGAIGLILLLFATIIDKVVIMGAGLGGWGIACVFAAAIGLVVTSILDSYAQEA